MGVFAALGRSGRTLVRPLHFLGFFVLACLPREDLASYTSGGAGGAAQGPSLGGSSGTDAGVDATGGQGGEGNPTDLPLEPGNMGSGADASAPLDGGVELSDAAVAQDAGALDADAGLVAAECAASQGTLVPNEDVCLIFVAQARVSWQAAALGCQSRSATLVSVKTVARDGFLSSLIDTDIWLGGFDPGTNPASNAFVWRDQTLVDTELATWAEDEPDAVADQFCVSKASPATGGAWRDAPCTELKAYVCERTL